ncbi:MAG: DUF1566 domain-containing protein [Legionellaceae bacterium]|nr:DUF1566 domain-containing protein [Legionellaceae bacterium]
MKHLSKFVLGLLALTSLFFLGAVHASPVWTFIPLTSTQVTVDNFSTATIQYTVTNQSRRTHTLVMRPMRGIRQTTTAGNCGSPMTLGYQESCTLTLVVTGSELAGDVAGGPILCQKGGGTLQCYEPFPGDLINITRTTRPPVVGDRFGGGTVACLTSDGGEANLIAATTDNSAGITWGGEGTSTGALSEKDGASNTATIVNVLTNQGSIDINTYAAGICATYENEGFTDWFLPAKDQLNCLYTNKQAVGGFFDDNYWTSTETTQTTAWAQTFRFGFPDQTVKIFSYRIRCVRAFTP